MQKWNFVVQKGPLRIRKYIVDTYIQFKSSHDNNIELTPPKLYAHIAWILFSPREKNLNFVITFFSSVQQQLGVSITATQLFGKGSLNFVNFCQEKRFKLCQFVCNNLFIMNWNTQVGSPAVRRRLARCTAWVKRWSEAMDFLQTIFKTNNVPIVSGKREAKIYKNSRNIMSL